MQHEPDEEVLWCDDVARAWRWPRRRNCGKSLNAMGRTLARIAHVVRYEVARTGGVPPPARQRSLGALAPTDREAISRGLAFGVSLRQIARAKALNRSS